MGAADAKRERGSGSLFREKYRDPKTGEQKQVETWTMKLWHDGKVLKKSSGESSIYRATKKLEAWKREVAGGNYVPDANKTTFGTLATLLLDEYRANGRRSADRAEDAVAHLRGFFTDFCPARSITTDRALAYVRHRQEQKAANATINRELAALKRMFKLGVRAGRVARRPHIDMLEERNTRTGFFEPHQFRAILTRLPEDLQVVFETAYVTGWRIKSEILTRRWQHVDFVANWLRLEPGETKNDDGRMFPLTADLRAVLERQRRRTAEHEKATGQIIPWVFHRSGDPIKSFRRAWLTACRDAGCPGRIPHDFRRTAVRNLERAGVPRSAAMAMVGHKTESIYRRYAIVSESDLRDGAGRIQALHDLQREPAALRARESRRSVRSVIGST
jgi:integrase